MGLMKLLIIISVVSSLFITSCSSVKKSNSSTIKSSSSSIVPSVAKKTLPGGDSDDWRYLGTNAQLVIEISESSIEPNKTPKTYKFVDRKRIIDTDKFKFIDNKQKFKYILSTWIINCDAKQYQSINASIYNDLGVKMKDISYRNNLWYPIKADTVSQMQYNYVCLGINRNLGY